MYAARWILHLISSAGIGGGWRVDFVVYVCCVLRSFGEGVSQNVCARDEPELACIVHQQCFTQHPWPVNSSSTVSGAEPSFPERLLLSFFEAIVLLARCAVHLGVNKSSCGL
jgi:hypothetical protein